MRSIEQFLQEECYTSPDQKDPAKPLILDEYDMVSANPAFDANAAAEADFTRRQQNLGTSFFVNFHPICDLHQIEGSQGDNIRSLIKNSLQERLMAAFDQQQAFQSEPEWPRFRQLIIANMEVALCPHGHPMFNNGETYLWIRGLPFKEDIIWEVLKAFKGELDKNPITLSIEGRQYEVLFYGWGFRYY